MVTVAAKRRMDNPARSSIFLRMTYDSDILIAGGGLNGPALALALARNGLTDAAIASEAGITIRTVRFHFDNIRRKLNARTRAGAVAEAVARHLLPV